MHRVFPISHFPLPTQRHGFYIVEAMIALGVLVFSFLGMITLLAKSLSLNRVVADSYVGNYLALEGVELVKNVVDANIAFLQNFNQNCVWNSGFQSEGSYEADWTSYFAVRSANECPGAVFTAGNSYQGRYLLLDSTGHYGYANGGTPTIFTRKITVTPNPSKSSSNPIGNPDEIKVESLVRWVTRGGGTFSATVEDRFFNWRRR